ncbi:MAG TPA: TolC family protein, partial [Xanthomonadales bacterium]|nr:TolC family protein [Xanthomonadales bacterium]
QQRVAASAEQRGFALDAAQLDAQRALARTARVPDVTTTLGVRRLEALDDQALVLSVSVPFGLAERATLAEARVDAERDALDERRRAAELEGWRGVFATYQELLHAKTEFDKLGTVMIPAAEAAVQLTQRGYDEARFSFVQLTQSRAVAAELRRQRLAAAARYHRLHAELERRTAAPDGATP